MQWFEPLIIIGAATFVVAPIIVYIYKKKKGTLKCECGHLQSECGNKCTSCKTKKIATNMQNGLDNHGHKYVLHVNGMKCGMCESHINDEIRRNADVETVKSYRNKNITVITSKNELDIDKISLLIQKDGYDITSVDKLF